MYAVTTDCGRTSRPLTCHPYRQSVRPDVSLFATANGNSGVYVDCVWVLLRSRDASDDQLLLQIVSANVASGTFNEK